MDPNNPPNIFITLSEIQAGVKTLIDRGKPVSPEDLQLLINAVEAKGRPTFDPASVAKVLAPKLLAEMPTPENLIQTGQQITAAINYAVREATEQSRLELAKVTAQNKVELSTATADLQRTVASIPRHVAVRGEVLGFTSLRAAGLLLGFCLLLVASLVWAMVSRSGMKDEVTVTENKLAMTQNELSMIQKRNKDIEHWLTFFVEHRKVMKKEQPKLVYKYFPYPNDTNPAAKRK
jgi:hypothetical protein